MKILEVRVITNAKKNEVIQEGDMLKVRVTAPPIEGRANQAVIELLADYFKVKKSAVRIIRGEKSKNKVVEID